nr:hypothetical protein [Neobacillus sp. Marseille-Q6967]
MAGNELVGEMINIILAILWIWIFLQNLRKRTVILTHVLLFVLALGILLNSLYEAINSWRLLGIVLNIDWFK